MKYPQQCLSVYCGRIDCTGCKHKPKLDSYKRKRDAEQRKRDLDLDQLERASYERGE